MKANGWSIRDRFCWSLSSLCLLHSYGMIPRSQFKLCRSWMNFGQVAIPLPKGHFSLKREANAIVNFCHYHPSSPPPRTPGDLHQKFAPNLGLLHLSFCPGGGAGRGFVGVAPEARAFVYKRFLPCFWIFIIMARIGDWQHLGVYLLLWNFMFQKKIIQS